MNQQLRTTTADGSYAVFPLRYFEQKLNIKCQSHRCNRNKQKAEARGGGLVTMDGNVLCSTQKNTMDFIIRIIMKLMRMIMKHCSAQQQQQQLRSKFMQAIYKIMMNFDQPSRLSITAYVSSQHRTIYAAYHGGSKYHHVSSPCNKVNCPCRS